MRTVNFGRGTRAAYGPGTPNRDVVIEIPALGRLASIQGERYAAFERFASYSPSLIAEECIVVAIPAADLSGEWDRAEEVKLCWSEDRQEWVAFHFREWVEDVWGTDLWALGPFALEDSPWPSKIAEAFGVRGISDEDLIHMSPQSLTTASSGPANNAGR